jgi:hypothetical protein
MRIGRRGFLYCDFQHHITVKTALTFKVGFSGSKIEYLYVSNANYLTSGWQNRGTWTVP